MAFLTPDLHSKFLSTGATHHSHCGYLQTPSQNQHEQASIFTKTHLQFIPP